MKIIKYNLYAIVEDKEILTPVVMGWNSINEEIAKREAYNGVYTIEDDGQPEVVSVQADVDNMLVDHELRLTMLELGV